MDGHSKEWRKFTVALAWLSPVDTKTQKYRSAFLWFEGSNNIISATRTGADHNAVRRGTVQHEVFEGDRAIPVSDGDSLEIKVNCREDATKIINPIPYGLIVSLEVAEGIDIAVYDEIRTRIAPTIKIEQHAQGDVG